MIIDFEKIPETKFKNMLGGSGTIFNHAFIDKKAKIVKGVIPPGSSTGYHMHISGFEVMYVLNGSLLYRYDDGEERVVAGQVHYCPHGHKHCMFNDTDEEVAYLSVVVK